MISPRFRMVTQRRLEVGLWASATACQRFLMLAGGVLLAAGCWTLSANEDVVLEERREAQEAMGLLRTESCRPDRHARRRLLEDEHALLHLEGCAVRNHAEFSEKTEGLEELRYFREALPPEPVRGLWFRVHLEEYSKSQGGWRPVPSARNLEARQLVARSVRVGGFAAEDAVLLQVPGEIVPLRETLAGAESPFGGAGPLTDGTMHLLNGRLHSGDPVLPSDGDVRVWFTAGREARTLSTLSGVLGRGRTLTLRPWSARGRRFMDFSRGLPGLSAAVPGSLDAKELLEVATRSLEVNRWPVRALALLAIWTAMSLILFPNHVVPDFCGGCCCVRSAVPALVTAAAAWGASWGYVNAPEAMTVMAALAVPPLLLMAAGYRAAPQVVARWLLGRLALAWYRRRLPGSPGTGGAADAEAYQRAPGDEHEEVHLPRHEGEGLKERLARSAALGAGLALVVAGPLVKALAALDVVGLWGFAVNPAWAQG